MVQKKGEEAIAVLKKDGKYFRLGLTLLTVVILSIIFALTLENLGTVFSAVKSVIAVFSFVFYGIAFAYLMNPILKLVEKGMLKLLSRSNMTERGMRKLARIVGVIVALLVFLAIVYGLIAMVLPELIKSVTETFSSENLQNYYEQITNWINNVVKGTPVEDWFRQRDPIRIIQDWLNKEQQNILAWLGELVTGAYGIGKVLFNMIIGIIAAVYLLISKEKFIAQAKKLTVALFKPKRADRLFEIGRLTNRSFGGFIVGKLIDSLIIGILSYIGMVILKLPYALISSTFVGVSNIIPFFGPLIGIVIGGVLILLQNPLQALYFLIFELILQQVDGNIIGPRILGERLGISDFWVLVSITVFGAAFGFPGMILGVPIFTIFYTLVSEAVRKSVRKKELPEETEKYYPILEVNDLNKRDRDSGEPVPNLDDESFETEYDPEEEFEFEDPGE